MEQIFQLLLSFWSNQSSYSGIRDESVSFGETVKPSKSHKSGDYYETGEMWLLYFSVNIYVHLRDDVVIILVTWEFIEKEKYLKRKMELTMGLVCSNVATSANQIQIQMPLRTNVQYVCIVYREGNIRKGDLQVSVCNA